MNKKQVTIVCLGFILLAAWGIYEGNIFIAKKDIVWKKNITLSWDDFRGNPRIFTKYGAAIYSLFEYKIYGELSIDSIVVTTFMETKNSWKQKDIVHDDYALRHELYHFNISEIVARRFRKKISDIKHQNPTKKTIEDLYSEFISELREIQKQYDDDTDHSLIIEKQKDWDYIVDSLLNQYSYYAIPVISFSKKQTPKQYSYYKKVVSNDLYQLEGKFPIDANIANHSKHVRCYYTGNKLSKIEYWNGSYKSTIDDDSNISFILFEYSGNKEIRKYFDENNNPCTDENGIYGIEIIKDNNMLSIHNYNESYEYSYDTQGVFKTLFVLDNQSRKKIKTYYDKNGKQIYNYDGMYKILYTYESNYTSTSNVDDNDNLINDKDGIAVYLYQLDSRNNVSSYQYYNKNKELTEDRKGNVIYNQLYDLDGNVISVYCINSANSIVVDSDGIAYTHYKYDMYGNMIEESNYGLYKNLIISENKIGRILYTRDYENNMIETLNIDAYNKPLNTIDGICKTMEFYDKTLLSDIVQFTLDSTNSILFKRKITYNYNSKKQKVLELYYDTLNKLLPDSNNICKISYSYDEAGNMKEISYLNTNNKLQNNKEGIAVIRKKYDANNNCIEVYNYNSDMNLIPRGIAKVLLAYDINGNVIEQKYFDSHFNILRNEHGVEIVKYVYNSKNKIVKELYFNSKSELCENNKGYAVKEYSYDLFGNNTEIRLFNESYSLTDNIAIIVYEYRDKLLHKIKYFNDKYILTTNKEGYAIEVYDYDDLNRNISIDYLSNTNKRIKNKDNYSRIEYKYDVLNNVIAILFFDEYNNLHENNLGVAIYNYFYNRNGEIIDSKTYKAQFKHIEQIDYGKFISTTNFAFSQYNDVLDSFEHMSKSFVTFHSNGNKKTSVKMINGKMEGTYYSWYETGELESKIEFKNGLRNGKSIEYHKNGNMKEYIEYTNGKLVPNSKISWHYNGNIHTKYIDNRYAEWDINGNRIE